MVVAAPLITPLIVVCPWVTMAKQILDYVIDINSSTLNIQGDRNSKDFGLNTYYLTEEQKNSNLDLISGYQIIDSNHRIFFFEGSDHRISHFANYIRELYVR